MKKVFEFLTSRMFFIILIFLAQLSLLYFAYILLRDKFILFYVLNLILGIVLAVHIINKDINPAYKITWLIPIFVFPVFGSVMYLFFAQNRFVSNIRISMGTIVSSFHYLMSKHENVLDELSNIDAYIESRYMERYANFPVYKYTESYYFPSGESYFENLIKDLKKAENFIFMEYFIIEEGYMWDSILAILEEKVKEGVDVRLIYDDFGCMSKLPRHYEKTLQEKGIKCCVFNPIKFMVMPKHNNRDHRKIVVIDGIRGYTGGINLADEYINKAEKFGHWKDSGIKLHGQAVWSLVVMFLSMWNSISSDTLEFEKHLIDIDEEDNHDSPEHGFIQPFSDSPSDSEPVGEVVYSHIINRAKKYVYITTPYLILSNEILVSLCTAAKGGIDVRIITPHIPDKKTVFHVTRSYYEQLLAAGVKIYEYTPGFIHAKNFVSDDSIAVVGSINVDFRSLYLHFEDAVWFHNSTVVEDVKKDFLETIEVSEQQTLHKVRQTFFLTKVLRSVLRVFAPLM